MEGGPPSNPHDPGGVCGGPRNGGSPQNGGGVWGLCLATCFVVVASVSREESLGKIRQIGNLFGDSLLNGIDCE